MKRLPLLFFVTALILSTTGKPKVERLYQFRAKDFARARFSEDGRHLLVWEKERAAVYNALSGKRQTKFELPERPFRVTATGDTLLARGHDNFQAFSIRSGRPLTRPIPHMKAFAVSPDGRWLALTKTSPEHRRAEVFLYDLDKGESRLLEGNHMALGLALSSQRLVVGGPKGWKLYELSSGSVLQSGQEAVHAAATSSCGSWMGLSGESCTEIWSLRSMKRTYSWPVRGRNLSFSPDSKLLAISSGSKRDSDRDGWEEIGETSIVDVGRGRLLIERERTDGMSPSFTSDSSRILTEHRRGRWSEVPTMTTSLFRQDGTKIHQSEFESTSSCRLSPGGFIAVGASTRAPNHLYSPDFRQKMGELPAGLFDVHPAQDVVVVKENNKVSVWRVRG
jgi:hypothetical protein